MPHPRVDQLRFARSEFRRGLEGISAEDAIRRLHIEPILDAVATGLPASTPGLEDMWAAWERVTAIADGYLDTMATPNLLVPLPHDGRANAPIAGNQLQRITYHYWSHIGEASAVRQILAHVDVPQFVGDIERLASYRPESD